MYVSQLSNATILFVFPKIFDALSKNPNRIVQSRLDSIKANLHIQKKALKEFLGEKGWYIASEIIVKNAWISYLVLSTLARGEEKSLPPTVSFPAFFTFAAASHVIRLGIKKCFCSERNLSVSDVSEENEKK